MTSPIRLTLIFGALLLSTSCRPPQEFGSASPTPTIRNIEPEATLTPTPSVLYVDGDIAPWGVRIYPPTPRPHGTPHPVPDALRNERAATPLPPEE